MTPLLRALFSAKGQVDWEDIRNRQGELIGKSITGQVGGYPYGMDAVLTLDIYPPTPVDDDDNWGVFADTSYEMDLFVG